MQYQSLEEETDMKLLEERIQRDGIVREGNVLKVDSFINHQMDIPLFREMAKEWKRLFAGKPVNKVLTIEASGIGIAAVVASEFNVPVVFAKKSMRITTTMRPRSSPSPTRRSTTSLSPKSSSPQRTMS